MSAVIPPYNVCELTDCPYRRAGRHYHTTTILTDDSPYRRPECPSCDDEWAAHVAGLHDEPA